MSEDRHSILDMLSEQKITVDDAERLLAALDREPTPAANAPRPEGTRSGGPPKYLRVVVDSLEDGADKPTKVNVRVPLQLLRAGVKLQGLLPPEARAHVNMALGEKGVDFDLGQIKPENVDELINALGDMMVDIDADGGRAKVKVYCE
jgi:hypothetical protein